MRASSLAGYGPFSDFHYFEIHQSEISLISTKIETKISWSWIVGGVGIGVVLIIFVGIAYYYKHKIVILFRRRDDSAVLMKNEEPTDFKASFNKSLSDIMENDED